MTGLLYAGPAAADPGEHLHFASGHHPPLSNAEHTGFNDMVLREMFDRAGLRVSLRRVPTGRAGPLANAGTEDGCGPRIAEFSRRFPRLVRIKEPVITFEFVAFTRDSGMKLESWADLAPYSVAHLTGSLILERQTNRHAGSVTSVRTVQQLFELLHRGRVDAVVLERWTGLYALKVLGYHDIHMHRTALARRPLFFFVNRKHRALVPRLEAALRDMKSDGTYDRTMVRVLNPLLAGY